MIPEGIDTRAPVIAHHSVVIDAPLGLIWRLHTDVDAWPAWQPNIQIARLDGPFVPGSTFSWYTSGLDIESTIYRVEPERHTLWGGPAQGIMGIHSFAFTPVRDGIRVDTAESWSGELVEANTTTTQYALDWSLAAWLDHLRAAAERR